MRDFIFTILCGVLCLAAFIGGFTYGEFNKEKAIEVWASNFNHGVFELDQSTGKLVFKWHKITVVGPNGDPDHSKNTI
jgi:hypothetical protein